MTATWRRDCGSESIEELVIRFKINFGVRSIDVARLAVESRVKEGEFSKAAWISDNKVDWIGLYWVESAVGLY